MLTDTELGWLAGILDGEGCILGLWTNRRRPSGGSFAVEVRVEATSLAMIGKLSELYQRAGIQFSTKSVPAGKFTTKQAHGIYVRRKGEVVNLLALVVDILTTKRQEALFVLEWYKRWPDQRGMGKAAEHDEKVLAFETLRRLKKTA